jgi:SagB-type dehydrogenase family enzyme
MLDLYESTSLSKKKVALKTGFLDWNMQPSVFKHYPSSLFSYELSKTPHLKMLQLARSVTSEHKIAAKPYKRLISPSAGNLHPLELYVQIRGIKGVLSGIYHLNSDEDALVLIRDIETDGIEKSLGLHKRFNGMIIMLSSVPFRSIWKYQERAIRYCYLDLGHQLAALEAAAINEKQKITFLSDFDTACVSRDMGFDEQEHVVAAVLCGEMSLKESRELDSPVMRVQPTDYYEHHEIQEKVFSEHQFFSGPRLNAELQMTEGLQKRILSRRSAREFRLEKIKQESLEHIMQMLIQLPQNISTHMVLMRAETHEPGLYRGPSLIREGMFVNEIVDLMVHQPFIYNASLVLVFSSPNYNAKILTQISYFTHVLNLCLLDMNLGMSGVGAFYDKDLQDFLKTQEKILYTVVLGNV